MKRRSYIVTMLRASDPRKPWGPVNCKAVILHRCMNPRTAKARARKLHSRERWFPISARRVSRVKGDWIDSSGRKVRPA